MAEMHELNEYQQIYLQIIFNFFHKEGKWPTYSYVERYIERTALSSYPDFDMYMISKSLPGGFASNFGLNRRYDDEAEFITPALYYCQGVEAEEERANFIRVLRFCIAKHTAFINEEASDKEMPEILSEELSSHLHMSPLVVHKMGLLLRWENDVTWGGGASDQEWINWSYNLKRGAEGVRRFKDVETFDQYLEKRTPIQWPDYARRPVISSIDFSTNGERNHYQVVQGDQYNIIGNSGDFNVQSIKTEKPDDYNEAFKEVEGEKDAKSIPVQENLGDTQRVEKVDVLLVTVTEVEVKAILSFFPNSQLHHIQDQTYHNLGIIKGARIFMVQSEMGSGGPSGATLTIEEGIRLLNPSAVIMVGIAFGVSEREQTIGDILISKQLIPYDLQRVGTDRSNKQEIYLRDNRPSASHRMLQRFRAAAIYWQSPPKVEFGPILSGAKLIDNQDFRDQLLKFAHQAVGGEMEGSGLYAAAQRKKVDWIVVKAICDWADGNKYQDKKQRQQLAARNAARFTVFVLEQGGFGKLEQETAEKPALGLHPANYHLQEQRRETCLRLLTSIRTLVQIIAEYRHVHDNLLQRAKRAFNYRWHVKKIETQFQSLQDKLALAGSELSIDPNGEAITEAFITYMQAQNEYIQAMIKPMGSLFTFAFGRTDAAILNKLAMQADEQLSILEKAIQKFVQLS